MTIPRRLFTAVIAALLLAGCATLVADSIESLLEQGIELFTARKYDKAIEKFLEVVRRDPTAWNAHLYLARSYIAKSSWTDAIASGRKALELAPDRGEVVPVLAEALLGAGNDALNRGQFGEAARHLSEYVKLRPTDFRGHLQLGRAFLGSGSYQDAARAFVRGLGQVSDASDRQQLLVGLLDGDRQALSSGDARGAITLLQQYVRYDHDNASAYVELGKAYWQTGSRGNALRAFQRGLQLNPNDPEAQQFLGGRR